MDMISEALYYRAAMAAADHNANKVIQYHKTRPVEKPISGGGTSTEWYEGTTKRVVNVFPKDAE